MAVRKKIRNCPGCGNEKRDGRDGVSQVSAALMHCRKCDRWFANFEGSFKTEKQPEVEGQLVRMLKKIKAVFKQGSRGR